MLKTFPDCIVSSIRRCYSGVAVKGVARNLRGRPYYPCLSSVDLQLPTTYKVLAIETSCDDTCAAVVQSDGKVLSNIIASQVLNEHVFFE